MIEPKLLMRSGVAISVIGHVAILTLGLIFAGANPFDSVPAEAITVDIVSPEEAGPAPVLPEEPAPESAPSFETLGPAAPAPAPQAPPTAAPLPPKPQTQAPSRPNPQRDARQAAIQPQPQPAEPIPPQSPMPPPPPSLAETHEPDPSEMFGLPLALPGGKLGGSFDAPAVDSAKIDQDDTAAFRARVSSCSSLPAGIAPDEKIRIVLRVAFKPDGTLAARPLLIEASASPKGPALMQNAITALQKCQPYTMLPAEKYKEWKTIDLSFTPLNFPGR